MFLQTDRLMILPLTLEQHKLLLGSQEEMEREGAQTFVKSAQELKNLLLR